MSACIEQALAVKHILAILVSFYLGSEIGCFWPAGPNGQNLAKCMCRHSRVDLAPVLGVETRSIPNEWTVFLWIEAADLSKCDFVQNVVPTDIISLLKKLSSAHELRGSTFWNALICAVSVARMTQCRVVHSFKEDHWQCDQIRRSFALWATFQTIILHNLPTFLGNFVTVSNLSLFWCNYFWATFIDIWRFLLVILTTGACSIKLFSS